jgi:hypothetical protein
VNAVNAAFTPAIIGMFRGRGWKVIDASQAFADPIFATEPDVLPAGESLIWALARARGEPDLRYPGEDAVYEKPLLDAAGL